jgi:hypothetical protein
VTHPSNCTVTEGDIAAFTVEALSENSLTYQWYRDAVAIPGADCSCYVMPATTLADDGALFMCVVTSYQDTVISNAAILTVNMAPPVIATSPSDQGVWKGQDATFTVVATGSGPMTYQWQECVDAVWQDMSGETDPSYTILETAPADSGRQFRCEVTNAAGSTTSDAAILIVGAGFAKTRGVLGSPLRERSKDGLRQGEPRHGDPLARRGDASLLLRVRLRAGRPGSPIRRAKSSGDQWPAASVARAARPGSFSSSSS